MDRHRAPRGLLGERVPREELQRLQVPGYAAAPTSLSTHVLGGGWCSTGRLWRIRNHNLRPSRRLSGALRPPAKIISTVGGIHQVHQS